MKLQVQILKLCVILTLLSGAACNRIGQSDKYFILDPIVKKLDAPYYDSLIQLDDTSRFIRFSKLPYRGLTYDSVKCILGEPDYMHGEKVILGNSSDMIAPLFKNDSIIVFRVYEWNRSCCEGKSIVLYYETTRSYSKIDTPFWGFCIDLTRCK